MKLSISQLDRAALSTVFLRPNSRGGSEAILLAQDELHTLLGIDEFADVAEVKISDLSSEGTEVEIPDRLVPVLREMLGWPGQNPKAARVVAPILRALGGGP